MTKYCIIYLIAISGFILANCSSQKALLGNNNYKKWHRVTLEFSGPETNELDEVNPFLDYRLDVTFTHKEKEYIIPGFYAAGW